MRTCFGEIVHQYQHFKLNHKSDKFFCTLALRFLNHRDFRVVLKMVCNIILHPPVTA